jgi:hypothetical protein
LRMAATNSSFFIACQPAIPISRAVSAKSRRVCVFRSAVVINLATLFNRISHPPEFWKISRAQQPSFRISLLATTQRFPVPAAASTSSAQLRKPTLVLVFPAEALFLPKKGKTSSRYPPDSEIAPK